MSISLNPARPYSPVNVGLRRRKNTREESGPPGESTLLSRAQAGDEAAFEELVRLYRDDVYRLAAYYLRDREEAWDISQEVFVKAYKSLARFRGDAAVKTWLLRITSNCCKDYLKKRRLPTVSLSDYTDAESKSRAPDAQLSDKETGSAIMRAVDELGEKHRTVILLREFEGLSYEDIAGVVECSIGTVMSRLHHARKKIRLALENDEGFHYE